MKSAWPSPLISTNMKSTGLACSAAFIPAELLARVLAARSSTKLVSTMESALMSGLRIEMFQASPGASVPLELSTTPAV